MRTMTSREAERAFTKVIETAQREPVAVTENGEFSAVVMSYDDYQRLTGQARRELQDAMKRMRAHAAEQGLSEETLAELLADDS